MSGGWRIHWYEEKAHMFGALRGVAKAVQVGPPEISLL